MVQFELFAHTGVGEMLIYAMTSYTSLQPSTTALSATVPWRVYYLGSGYIAESESEAS